MQTRRDFLRKLGAAGAGLATTRGVAIHRLGRPRQALADPLPPVITGRYVLRENAEVASLVIEREGHLVFDPTTNVTLRSHGNIHVKGRLTMRPTSSMKHTIEFVEVNEAAFQGGGDEPMPSDVGLWAMESGRLNLEGSDKRPWTRLQKGVEAGVSTILLDDDPVGWKRGDQLVITPTLSPEKDGAFEAYDISVVAGIDGRRISLKSPTVFAHPEVRVGRGRAMRAEVLNLTRNVKVQGTKAGRAHIFVHSDQSQHLKSIAVRHMGPRKLGKAVLGRYGLHFHKANHGTHGTVVSGVVIRDAGSHAFVPHESNGITFSNCISHNTLEEPYWWDPRDAPGSVPPQSNGVKYIRCVASRADGGNRLGGFWLGSGYGNVVRGCVAVGIKGDVNSSGFVWPEISPSEAGRWIVEGCIAHNNAGHGIFVWQNSEVLTIIKSFIGYYNRGAGTAQGAYHSRYQYRDCLFYGNQESSIDVHANSLDIPMRFVDTLCDGGGLSDYAVVVKKHKHSIPPRRPTLFKRTSFQGYKKAAVGFIYDGEDGESTPEIFDFVNCRYSGNEFWLESEIHSGSRIRVEDPVRGSIVLRRQDVKGRYVEKWNARVRNRAV